jgi:Uma2 family endonuclease
MATMSLTEQDVADDLVILNLQYVAFSDEQFIELCADNRDFRFELTAQKELVIMTRPPPGTGRRSGRIYYCLEEWARKNGMGPTFPPGVLFQLPNGAKRGPDASWVSAEVWEALSREDKGKISLLSPDFVVESMSPSDRRPVRFRMLQAKMEEYIANGVRLGWMIDPFQKKVYVYRPEQLVECLDNPTEISGNPVLPGFALNIADIWNE